MLIDPLPGRAFSAYLTHLHGSDWWLPWLYMGNKVATCRSLELFEMFVTFHCCLIEKQLTNLFLRFLDTKKHQTSTWLFYSSLNCSHSSGRGGYNIISDGLTKQVHRYYLVHGMVTCPTKQSIPVQTTTAMDGDDQPTVQGNAANWFVRVTDWMDVSIRSNLQVIKWAFGPPSPPLVSAFAAVAPVRVHMYRDGISSVVTDYFITLQPKTGSTWLIL